MPDIYAALGAGGNASLHSNDSKHVSNAAMLKVNLFMKLEEGASIRRQRDERVAGRTAL